MSGRAGGNSCPRRAAAALLGRLRRAHSKETGCGALAWSDEPDRGSPNRFFPRRRVCAKYSQEAGWANGQNVEIHTRWAAGDLGQYQRYAAQLVAIEPDVILAATTPAVRALQKASPTVLDCYSSPLSIRWIEFDREHVTAGWEFYGLRHFRILLLAGEERLQLLEEVAPSVTRAAVLRVCKPSRRHRLIRRTQTGGIEHRHPVYSVIDLRVCR